MNLNDNYYQLASESVAVTLFKLLVVLGALIRMLRPFPRRTSRRFLLVLSI